jgi:hypothetical protein
MNFKKRKNTLRKLYRTRKALQKTLNMIKSEEYKYYQKLYYAQSLYIEKIEESSIK